MLEKLEQLCLFSFVLSAQSKFRLIINTDDNEALFKLGLGLTDALSTEITFASTLPDKTMFFVVSDCLCLQLLVPHLVLALLSGYAISISDTLTHTCNSHACSKTVRTHCSTLYCCQQEAAYKEEEESEEESGQESGEESEDETEVSLS